MTFTRRTLLATALGGLLLTGCTPDGSSKGDGSGLRKVGKVPGRKGDIPRLAGDVVITAGEDAASVLLDASNLKTLWRHNEFVHPFAGGFIALEEKHAVALDPRTGAVRWRSAPLSDASRRLAMFGIVDGIVAVGAVHKTSTTDQDIVSALDLASGRTLWTRPLPDVAGVLGRTLLVKGPQLIDSRTGRAVKSPLDLRQSSALDRKWGVSNAVEVRQRDGAEWTMRVVDPVTGTRLLDPGWADAGYGYTAQKTLMGSWFFNHALCVQVAGQPARKVASTHSDHGNVVAVVGGVIWCTTGERVRPFDMEGRPVAGSVRGTLMQASEKFVLMEEMANGLTGERRYLLYAMPGPA